MFPSEAIGFSAMSNALDSSAVFTARLQELGLADLHEVMTERGWGSLGSFAFAIPPSANGVDYDLFASRVVAPLLGAEDSPRASTLLRLHFEAHTVAVAEMRRPPIMRGYDPRDLGMTQGYDRDPVAQGVVAWPLCCGWATGPWDMIPDSPRHGSRMGNRMTSLDGRRGGAFGLMPFPNSDFGVVRPFGTGSALPWPPLAEVGAGLGLSGMSALGLSLFCLRFAGFGTGAVPSACCYEHRAGGQRSGLCQTGRI